MATLNVRRIDFSEPAAAQQLASLRKQLSAQGNVVSQRGRELTEAVFREPLCPAQAAGVRELAVVVPPTANGGYNRDLLAACHELGVTEVYRVGGAQAVAALAYGVEGIAAVDMIVGPGNLFVTLAKRHVFGQVAIDMLAGPTEVVVLADDSAPPEYVAADLISQAEHAPGSSILITWHKPLLDEVTAALQRQLPRLPRGTLARESLESFGALVQSRNEREAIACVNRIGPEHLHIATRNPEALLECIV